MTEKKLPNIYIYNPTCEIAIANGTLSFFPNKTLSKFEKGDTTTVKVEREGTIL